MGKEAETNNTKSRDRTEMDASMWHAGQRTRVLASVRGYQGAHAHALKRAKQTAERDCQRGHGFSIVVLEQAGPELSKAVRGLVAGER
jgi:hypothetical protein